MTNFRSISVFGAGAWGTAIAKLLAENSGISHDCSVTQWGRQSDNFNNMVKNRVNQQYLPEIKLPKNLIFVNDIKQALAADLILISIPSKGFLGFIQQYADAIKAGGHLVWATKGLEPLSRKPFSLVAEEVLGPFVKYAVISGPNFAVEVARRIPTATTVASVDDDFSCQIASILHNDWFRVYTSRDIIGVQLGGALKNALAIAAGIADGLKFGANTRAALLTRGMAEITRLAVAIGAQAETMAGLSGFGDLILSCTDDKSRNRRFGLLLADGYTIARAIEKIGQVVEGVETVASARQLAEEKGIEMPIIDQIDEVLRGNVSPQQAVSNLLSRESTSET